MLNLKEIFIALAAVSLGTYLVFSQDDSGTDADQQAQCTYLNNVRANFTICCEYPLFVIWYSDYHACRMMCKNTGYPNDRCCILTCCLNKLGVLMQTPADDGSGTNITDVDWKGLVYSFLLSVGNDTQWVDVITQSSQRCYEQFTNSGEYDCNGTIPMSLYSVVDCCYTENFIKCAKWNPYGLKECQYTSQYVSQCAAAGNALEQDY